MKTILFTAALITLALCAAEAPKAAPADPYGALTFTGKVLETMNAATYTYVRVDTGKATNWAATSQFPVKVGDTVTINSGMPMQSFHSKSLNRDFELIYFAGSATVAGAGNSTSAKPAELPAGRTECTT